MQGLDVQSLVSVPESDTDSVIETDDIEIVERKQHSSSIQATAVKPGETLKKQNPEKEDRYTGTVTWKVYLDYWKAGAGLPLTLLMMIPFLGAQAAVMCSDWWLAQWADIEDRRVSLSSNSSSGTSDLTETRKQNISIYSALVVSTFLLGFADAGLFLSFAISASQKLHNRMFERLLGAKIYFFDTNPVGRVLNRFSKDIGQIDELLPDTFFDYTRILLSAFSILLLNVATMPYLLAAAIPIVVLFLFIRHYYLKSSREIKRLEAMSKS